MTTLIRPVDVSISFGDVYARVTIQPGNMPEGLRAELHKVVDGLADQLNIGPNRVGLTEYAAALTTIASAASTDASAATIDLSTTSINKES